MKYAGDLMVKYLLYTGHSAFIVCLLVVLGTSLAWGLTEIVTVPTEDADYLTLAIKTVPALTVLGVIVYLFIRYLEKRDKDLRDLLERTITTLSENNAVLAQLKERYK